MTTGEGVALGFGGLVLLGGGYLVVSSLVEQGRAQAALTQELNQTKAQLAVAQQGQPQPQSGTQAQQNQGGGVGGFLSNLITSGTAEGLLHLAVTELH